MSDKISGERLNRVREILGWFKGDYEGVEEDQENFEAMRDAMVAIDEVLSRRATEVKFVELPDPSSNKYLEWSGDHNFRSVAYFKAVKDALNSVGINVAIKASGGTVEGEE